jgi:hypothetical protein
VKVCPDQPGGHVVEVEAAMNTYEGDARRPPLGVSDYAVSDFGVLHEVQGNRTFCKPGFIHKAAPIVLDCAGTSGTVELPELPRDTLFRVGNLPTGTFNLALSFTANRDLDMQLRDGSNPEVPKCVAGYSCLSDNVPGDWNEPVTFNYKNMTITFSGDDTTPLVKEEIKIDVESTTVPLEMWVNAYDTVTQAEVHYGYNKIEPCPSQNDRYLLKHECQACSALVDACPQGQTPLCDGSSEVKCS